MSKKKAAPKKKSVTNCKQDCKKTSAGKKRVDKNTSVKFIPVVPPPQPLPPISTQIRDKVFGMLGKIGWFKFND